jgi:hypothetical protein
VVKWIFFAFLCIVIEKNALCKEKCDIKRINIQLAAIGQNTASVCAFATSKNAVPEVFCVFVPIKQVGRSGFMEAQRVFLWGKQVFSVRGVNI